MLVEKTVDYSKLKTFTLQQAAEHLQYSVKTIKRMIVQGRFAPIIKPLGQTRIIAEDFYAWLDSEKDKAKSNSALAISTKNRRNRAY
jgi:predicted site-specific integrase-resolvase